MIGIVLAGGRGTRFHPVTLAVNKHLLDVYDEPMIFYPVRMLARAGIENIVVVTGSQIPQFKAVLGHGKAFGVRIRFAEQAAPRGIADALAQAEPYAGDQEVIVALGDNIFEEDLAPYVDDFSKQRHGSFLLLKEVSLTEARRFGVATVEGDLIAEIVEKPDAPRSGLAVTGCYMYDRHVFDVVRSLRPSRRGELEISDVNNAYVQMGSVRYAVIRGWWADVGTPLSKLEAAVRIATEKGAYPRAGSQARVSGPGKGR